MSRIHYFFLCSFFLSRVLLAEIPDFSLLPLPQTSLEMPTMLPLAQKEHEGLASWYGGKFQGRRTANGEVFDTNLPTAAHRTLPFDTKLRVINLDNGKSTEVRINDRGPFIEGRIIDLSRKAATELDMLRSGTARVRLEILFTPPPPEAYNIQISAFSDEDNAKALIQELSQQGLPVEIVHANDIHRVMLVNVPSTELEITKQSLSKAGYPSVLIRPQPLP